MLGRVVGFYGVQGGLKVFSYTKPREAVLDYERWFLKQDGVWCATKVASGKRHGKSVIVFFEGICDRDQAAAHIGSDIAIARDDLPPPAEGSYYWADLEGLRVVHRDGTDIGRVAYLMETGANDVLVTAGERERLIPFIADRVVLDVDIANGVITVDWELD